MWVMDEKRGSPLYVQLYGQIRADILSGALKAGARLRSSRVLAEELHISRNTVELAYDQLCAEGNITTRPREGYYVESMDLEPCPDHEAAHPAAVCKTPDQDALHDFRCGKLLLSELPCKQWQKLTSRCFHDYQGDLARRGSAFGETELRSEIRRYIHDYRNVCCAAEQVVVAPGTQFCLGLACRLLKSLNRGADVAMEEPGYDQSRITFETYGMNLIPMPLDRHGPDANILARTNAIAAYVTPSHQFPTGIAMPMSRRSEFAECVERGNAFVIEDDYNGHFPHDVKPIPALQSLCPGKVFYIGGFSDILFPCINVSYMVVPEGLMDRLHGWFNNHAPFVPFLTQKPLELFLQESHWESHLRRMRKIQKAKCEALVAALRGKFGDGVRISGHHAGLHLLVQPNWPAREEELIARACRAGVRVYPTSQCWSRPEAYGNATVLLNYGGVALEEIEGAVTALYQAWH